jgi:hypothetical protein
MTVDFPTENARRNLRFLAVISDAQGRQTAAAGLPACASVVRFPARRFGFSSESLKKHRLTRASPFTKLLKRKAVEGMKLYTDS